MTTSQPKTDANKVEKSVQECLWIMSSQLPTALKALSSLNDIGSAWRLLLFKPSAQTIIDRTVILSSVQRNN